MIDPSAYRWTVWTQPSPLCFVRRWLHERTEESAGHVLVELADAAIRFEVRTPWFVASGSSALDGDPRVTHGELSILLRGLDAMMGARDPRYVPLASTLEPAIRAAAVAHDRGTR